MSTAKKGNPVLGNMIVKIGQQIASGECGLDEDEINELVEIIGTHKITLEESADFLHCDRTTLSRKIRNEEIPTPRKDKGGKKYFFQKDLKQ